MKEQIQSLLRETLRTLIDEGKIPGYDLENLGLSIPSNKEFGDFASNAAMVMASLAKRKPRDIAAVIKERMDPLTDVFERIEIAGPGFINFTVSPRMWVAVLGEVLEAGERFGTSAYGRGEKVQVEFVSANPTGPCTWATEGARRWATPSPGSSGPRASTLSPSTTSTTWATR